MTLDQQCTVTRPGVAAIASALLVELLTSLLQHPLSSHAPAPEPKGSSNSGPIYERDPPEHALGLVPHQIRGFLANFNNLIVKGQSYPSCSACSKPIISAFRTDGWDFLKRALEDKEYVSELSGLAEVQRQAMALDEGLDWDEDEGMQDGDDEAVML